MDVKVKTDNTKGAKPIAFTFVPGDTLPEMVKKWGENVVLHMARSATIVAVQGFVRTGLKPSGKEKQIRFKTPKEIQAAVDSWKPGIKQRGKTPQEKLREQFQKMSPEERKRMLKDLGS